MIYNAEMLSIKTLNLYYLRISINSSWVTYNTKCAKRYGIALVFFRKFKLAWYCEKLYPKEEYNLAS